MVIQVYVDDSGVNDGRSKNLALAAMVAKAEQWAMFSDEWDACLKEPPALRYFKMNEAAGLSGQFLGLSEKERDAKLLALARIINRYVPLSACAGVNLAGFDDGFANKSYEISLGRDSYFWPFHTVIWEVTKSLWADGWRERLEFIFDEQVIHGLRAKEWYPAMRHIFAADDPGAATILPIEPIFRNDDEFLPLQAADMFAWNYRYSADNPGRPHPYNWLLPEFNRVKPAPGKIWTVETMEDIKRKAAAMRENPTPAMAKAWKGAREASKGIPGSKGLPKPKTKRPKPKI
jgi:hypothetical protein